MSDLMPQPQRDDSSTRNLNHRSMLLSVSNGIGIGCGVALTALIVVFVLYLMFGR